MKKVIPNIKVSDIPFFEGNISYEDKKRYGMIMPSGEINYYRVMFAKGMGGSSKENTWDRSAHMHKCCRSKVCWRHKTSCPRLKI